MGGCFLALSGKDSAVVAYIIRDMLGYSEERVPFAFCNTGLEYLSIQKHARQMGALFIKPNMNFIEIINTFGYPIISKEVADAIYFARSLESGKTSVKKREELRGVRVDELSADSDAGQFILTTRRQALFGLYPAKSTGQTVRMKSAFNKEKWLPAAQELPFLISDKCCGHMKKYPMQKYARKQHRYQIIGTRVDESKLRKQAWLKHGCNSFNAARSKSTPIAFWRDQDVLEFISKYNVSIPDVYGDIVREDGQYKCTGCDRTGCVYCCFGAHKKGDTRFHELLQFAPRQYEYAMGGGQWVDNPKYDPAAPAYYGQWKNWNPKKIWAPSKDGLGFRFVINQFNQLYPDNKISIPE